MSDAKYRGSNWLEDVVYAIIRSGGKQYRVSPGDHIKVESLPGKAGDAVEFGEVLAVRTDDKMVTGRNVAKASRRGVETLQSRKTCRALKR